MSTPSEPCECESCVPWDICTECAGSTWEDYDDVLQCRATALAWSTLRTLTGGLVGSCPVTMRPCLQRPCSYCEHSWINPVLDGGCWINQVCGAHGCSCARMCEINFPGKVAAIETVWIDGVVLDPGLYTLQNRSILVRTDGGCWPSCQRMDLALGAVGTMGIRYVPGVRPGPEGQYAAGVLAAEYAKACTGKGKCRLPSNVVSVVRRGVTMEMASGMFTNGQVGIQEVDAYVLALNPNRLRSMPMVWSPDLDASNHRFEDV